MYVLTMPGFLRHPLGGTTDDGTQGDGQDVKELMPLRMVGAVFPDARAATGYFHAVLREQSENMPAIADAPKAGENCVVVGGHFPDMVFGREGTPASATSSRWGRCG